MHDADLDRTLASAAALTKLDFENMKFTPEAATKATARRVDISSSFIWNKAPAGHDFWQDASAKYKHISKQEKPPNINAQIILHAMLKRHNELYGENNHDSDR